MARADYLLIPWFALVVTAGTVALVILGRRGKHGWVFAAVVLLGAVGSFPLFQFQRFETEWVVAGAGALVLSAVACLGLFPPSVRLDRCAKCGYDLSAETSHSGTRCPECGTPRPRMSGRCLECRADIRSAVAGGSIICPKCRAPIPTERR